MGIERKTQIASPPPPSLPLLSPSFDPSAYCDTSRTSTTSRAHAKKDSKKQRRRPRENAVVKFPPNRRRQTFGESSSTLPHLFFPKKLTLPCSPSGPLPPCRRERSPSRRRHRRCCCWQRRRRPRSPGRRGSSSRRRTRRPAAGRQTRRPGDGRPVVIGFFFEGRDGERRSALLRSPRERRRGGKRDRKSGTRQRESHHLA